MFVRLNSIKFFGATVSAVSTRPCLIADTDENSQAFNPGVHLESLRNMQITRGCLHLANSEVTP